MVGKGTDGAASPRDKQEKAPVGGDRREKRGGKDAQAATLSAALGFLAFSPERASVVTLALNSLRTQSRPRNSLLVVVASPFQLIQIPFIPTSSLTFSRAAAVCTITYAVGWRICQSKEVWRGLFRRQLGCASQLASLQS